MSRQDAEARAKTLDASAPSGWHYFAAHPELDRWAVFVVKPPLGKVEEVAP